MVEDIQSTQNEFVITTTWNPPSEGGCDDLNYRVRWVKDGNEEPPTNTDDTTVTYTVENDDVCPELQVQITSLSGDIEGETTSKSIQFGKYLHCCN